MNFSTPTEVMRDYFFAVLKKSFPDGEDWMHSLRLDPRLIDEIAHSLVESEENFRLSGQPHQSFLVSFVLPATLDAIELILVLSLFSVL